MRLLTSSSSSQVTCFKITPIPSRSTAKVLKPFHATDLFWYPLKTSENQGFFYVLRAYQKRSVAWNGLTVLTTWNCSGNVTIWSRKKLQAWGCIHTILTDSYLSYQTSILVHLVPWYCKVKWLDFFLPGSKVISRHTEGGPFVSECQSFVWSHPDRRIRLLYYEFMISSLRFTRHNFTCFIVTNLSCSNIFC